jgi:hypothetical protein
MLVDMAALTASLVEQDWGAAALATIEFVRRRPFRGTLARDTVLSGIPCRADTVVEFRPHAGNWWAYRGTLAVECEIDGLPCAAGRPFERVDTGVLVAFFPAREIELGGVPCQPGALVRRSLDRRLTVATLAQTRDIDGVPCRQGGPVHFNTHRRLTHALLARRFVAGGVAYRADTLISGDLPRGPITGATLDDDAVIDGLPCAGGTTIRREWQRHRLSEFTLAADATVDGFPCRAGTAVRRHGVRTYVLARPHEVRGIVFDRDDVVTIDEWADYDRGVPSIRLAAPRRIRNREFPANSHVQLHGRLFRRVCVTLGAEIALDGVLRPAGTVVRFGLGTRVREIWTPPGPARPPR